MKKLNTNTRASEDPAASAASVVLASNFVLPANNGAYTQREISGGMGSSVSPRGH